MKDKEGSEGWGGVQEEQKAKRQEFEEESSWKLYEITGRKGE